MAGLHLPPTPLGEGHRLPDKEQAVDNDTAVIEGVRTDAGRDIFVIGDRIFTNEEEARATLIAERER